MRFYFEKFSLLRPSMALKIFMTFISCASVVFIVRSLKPVHGVAWLGTAAVEHQFMNPMIQAFSFTPN